MPDTPAITEIDPEFADLLPWGPFFGIFVKQGTPDEVVAKLTEAFQAGAENPDFLSLMDGRGFRMLSLSGDEAEDCPRQLAAPDPWVLWDAEIAKTSPEEFAIERP